MIDHKKEAEQETTQQDSNGRRPTKEDDPGRSGFIDESLARKRAQRCERTDDES